MRTFRTLIARSQRLLTTKPLSVPTFEPLLSQSHLLRRSRHFSNSNRRDADFTHVVIGGGVVGLAIARRLQSRNRTTPTRVLLIERHGTFGSETSSRNSEVIHAGIYYGHGSLKTRLCIAGKQRLYGLCEDAGIPHRRCGKWVVAQDEAQIERLEQTRAFADEVGVETRLLTPEEAKGREPDVRAEAGVLESPTTGILDTHSLMAFMENDFVDGHGGDVAYGTRVTGLEAVDGGKGGWKIRTRSGSKANPEGSASAEDDEITADTVINSAGLGAVHIHNMVAPPAQQLTPFYAKGSYYSYSARHPKPSVLVYPAPVPGHTGLGTHLTLDMAGRVRFGPDVQWVDDPNDLSVNDNGFETALADIETYLPGLQRDKVGLDYCGIRPKLSRKSSATAGENFTDFVIEKGEDKMGVSGWIDLLGIESPGVTSSLAIAEHVEGMLVR